MGYSTCGSHRRRTCDRCDRCPTCEGAPRLSILRCPVGWCGPVHVCRECRPIVSREWTHDTCAGNSARFKAEQHARELAHRAGQPVIKAGVSLSPGRVFAWLTNGERYEVTREAYDAGLARIDHVLDLTGARRRLDEHPPEVYGPAGAAPRYADDDAQPAEVAAILTQLYEATSAPAPQEECPFTLTSQPAPRRPGGQERLF